MARESDRFIVVGETDFEWERQAIDFAFAELADRHDPFQGRALVELLDPSNGSLYEIDLLLIGYSAIYLVEIKSHPGRIEGDHVDWRWTTPEGQQRYLESPLSLTNKKCKVLRTLLERTMRSRAPWVQPLIFLSDPNVQINLQGAGRTAVVGRAGFKRAVVHGEFPGNEKLPRQRIPKPLMQDLVRAFAKLGLRARKHKLKIGEYELGQHLGDGRTFQDYEATHTTIRELRRRARIYRIPEQTSSERQAAARRQAEREVRLLHEVGQHPGILSIHEYYSTDPPALLFDEFEDGVALDVFLHRHPALSDQHRLEILDQLRQAIAHCHRKEITHGGLSPECVLIRERGGSLETRLINFQLGGSEAISPTIHRTEVLSAPASVYQAPELAGDAASRGRHSDVFGLGAIAFLLFTGAPPAADITTRDAALERDRALDPWSIRADIPEAIRDAIIEATRRIPFQRIDDADVWYESMLASLTAPDRELAEQLSPLKAQAGDFLEGGMEVRGVLGHGASARVIEVVRDGQSHALKVSLGPEHDPLLLAEGELLKRLRHASIVPCRDILTLGERTCLLLGLAGAETLQRHLTEEGPLDVDEAIRYGEDLFEALDYLATESVLHRDIKPGNLGIGARQKKARRLTLFDFSLVEVPLTDVRVGTDAYRDPFLKERGRWDHAADRWSAAITLHEALTGARPGWGALGQPLPDPSLPLVLAAERFDPAVRDRLVLFFERALAPEPDDRFPSAREMRKAWVNAFEAPRFAPLLSATSTQPPEAAQPPAATIHEEPKAPLGPRDLARIDADTPLADLPLSLRAKNALERAGISRMAELLTLPNNRLSAIRGIGRKVAVEIFNLREGWQERHAEVDASAGVLEPFFVGLPAGELFVTGVDLPPALAQALTDAGFETLQAVAAAPRRQIERLLVRAGIAAEELRSALRDRADGQGSDELPSLERWIDLLLPPPATKSKKERSRHLLRQLFGLEDPFAGKLDVRVREVAALAGLTHQRIYQTIGQAEAEWRKQAALPALQELALSALDDLGGAAPLERAADALLRRLDHADGPAAHLTHQAAVLLQILARLAAGDENEEAAALLLARPDDGLWIARSPEHVAAIRGLGEAADRLAARQPLAASGEVELALREVVAGTPLANLDLSRLADLAAAASSGAARSSRNELYPRGMDPGRAIELSAQILTNDLAPDEIQARVRARYPEAALLPEGEPLHALLAPLGLRWDPARERYVRPQASAIPSTSVPKSTRAPTAMPGQSVARDTEANEARDFEDQLRVLLLRGGLRVLQLNADWTIKGSAALIRFLRERHPEARILHLDQEILDRMEALLVERGGEPELLAETDAEGPEGEYWPLLADLAADAADALLGELVPAATPTLLLQPGLCARYDLRRFAAALVEKATRLDGAAILLVVPSVDEAGAPTIRGLQGALALPGLLPGQRAKVPRSWILNRHRAAEGVH